MMIAAMDWFDDLAKSLLAILFLIDAVRDLMSFALGLSGEYAASARNSVHARKWSGDSDSSLPDDRQSTHGNRVGPTCTVPMRAETGQTRVRRG